MHVFNGFDELEHIVFDPLLRKVIRPSLDGFVHILLHEFEDEGKSTRGLIVKNFDELDDVRMWVKALQGFDFP